MMAIGAIGCVRNEGRSVAALDEELHAHRVFLDVFEDNVRAQHLYRSFGFAEEGTMREAAMRDGQYYALVLMSMLDREFAARHTHPD